MEDRKLLEKRRTIGKTFEKLGRPLFEAAIGYKMEGKYRRKQKMYHVIARCRVVNGLRKSGEELPMDAVKLTALIDRKMQEKATRNAMLSEIPPTSSNNGTFRSQQPHVQQHVQHHSQPPHPAQPPHAQAQHHSQGSSPGHDDKPSALLAAVAAQQQDIARPPQHGQHAEGDRRTTQEGNAMGHGGEPGALGTAQKRRHP